MTGYWLIDTALVAWLLVAAAHFALDVDLICANVPMWLESWRERRRRRRMFARLRRLVDEPRPTYGANEPETE